MDRNRIGRCKEGGGEDQGVSNVSVCLRGRAGQGAREELQVYVLSAREPRGLVVHAHLNVHGLMVEVSAKVEGRAVR